jgi:hypothetical protein
MSRGYAVQMSKRRRIGLALAVSCLIGIGFLWAGGFLEPGAPRWVGTMTVVVGWGAFSLAMITAELVRLWSTRLAHISEENHWFMVLCLFGLFISSWALGLLAHDRGAF